MLMSRSGPDVGVAVFAARRRFPDDTSSSEDDCPPRRVTPLNETLVSSDSFRAKRGERRRSSRGVRSLNLQVSLQLLGKVRVSKSRLRPNFDEETYQSTESSRETHRDPC